MGLLSIALNPPGGIPGQPQPTKTTMLRLFRSSTLFFCLLLILLPGLATGQRVYLDITAPEVRKINFAIPWFAGQPGQNNLGQELADTLGRALAFHGIIAIVNPEKYRGNHNADWGGLGADYTILGQYSKSGDKLNLEIRLFDVAGKEVILGKSFSGPQSEDDRMLYKYCDAVIENLTGQPGVADSRIAFVSSDRNVKEVFLTDILGKKVRQITRHQHLTVSPRFVPGGNLLSYTSYHSGNQNLYITDLRQDKVTRALSRRKGLNLAPAWSADGKTMILTLSTDGNPDLYLLDNKGEIIEQLTHRAGINVSPALSADGRYLVFVSDRSGKPQLYLMDMRSRKTNRLTFEGSENAEPSWSPNGELIVYSSLRDGVYQIFIMNPLKNDMPRQLTFDPSHHEAPNWSPDGNQVIFAKRDGNTTHLYGILQNGSFQRRLFRLPGSQSYPQWSR